MAKFKNLMDGMSDEVLAEFTIYLLCELLLRRKMGLLKKRLSDIKKEIIKEKYNGKKI